MPQPLTIEYLQDKITKIQKATGSFVCIAGGAPRDLLNGRPVNDIDVFFPLQDRNSILEILKDELNFTLKKIQHEKENEYLEASFVYEGKYEGYPWQFVFMPIDTKELNIFEFVDMVLDSFDYCICQVALKPFVSDVHFTRFYERNIEEKRITRNPNRNPDDFHTAKAKKRIQKLLTKYPDFTYTPPEEPLVNTNRHLNPDTRWLDELVRARPEAIIPTYYRLRRPIGGP